MGTAVNSDPLFFVSVAKPLGSSLVARILLHSKLGQYSTPGFWLFGAHSAAYTFLGTLDMNLSNDRGPGRQLLSLLDKATRVRLRKEQKFTWPGCGKTRGYIQAHLPSNPFLSLSQLPNITLKK